MHRGYSDSVEWVHVSVLDEYTSFLHPFTAEQIAKGFPEYYLEIRPELDKITDLINKYKINKSIESISEVSAEDEENRLSEAANQYVSYDLVHKLKQYLELLHERQGALIMLLFTYNDREVQRHFP